MIPRRSLLACAPIAFAACARAAEKYFGNTRPPKAQCLVTTLDNEPPSLDPPLSSGLIDSLILSMFDAELRKPFIRGLGENLLDRQQFKYVWIDTNWRRE